MHRPSILITGCSSGIGYAAAKALHEQGWLVIAAARGAADVEKLKKEGLNAVQINLHSSDSISMALDWVLRTTDGKLNALFNNAGFVVPGAIEDLSRAALAYQIDACLLGMHELTVGVLQVMRTQGYGRIINNSSVLGYRAIPYQAAYIASQFALEGWTDALRLELWGSGISVSLLESSAVRTEFWAHGRENFAAWVNTKTSIHKLDYLRMLQFWNQDSCCKAAKSPDDVVKVLLRALHDKHPKSRYYVDRTSRLAAWAKRLLPTSRIDARVRRLYSSQKIIQNMQTEGISKTYKK